MKKFLSILFLFFIIFHEMIGQQTVGEWRSYLAYGTTQKVVEANNLVFAIADGSLYSYDKNDKSINVYSRETGLSDNELNSIAFNSDNNTLLIVYTNGNIDLLGEKGIYNIPYLKNATTLQFEKVNDIVFDKSYAYLSTNFGIVVIDMDKREIHDTYRLNRSVYSLCILNNQIYAATSSGILQGDRNKNLLDINNWESYSLSTSGFNVTDIRKIVWFQNTFCFYVNKKGLYYEQNGTVKSMWIDGTVQNMSLQNGELLAHTDSTIYIFSSLTDKESIKLGIVNDVSSLKDPNIYWIASDTEGIIGIKRNTGGKEFEVIVSNIKIDSPKRNFIAYMTTSHNKLLIVGGGRWANRLNNPGTLMVYDNESWFNFDEKKIEKEAGIKFSDATSVAVDPKDANHYFVSTWGEGLFEFKENEFVNRYTHTNSELSSALPNNPDNYVRVEGVCFDNNNNIWMTNSAVTDGIKILKADGTWSKIYYDALTKVALVDKILITSKGQKWVNILRPTPGIFVFDDNKTIDDPSDDTYHLYSSFNNSEGKDLEVSGFYCVTEDKKGNIWIGTNKGPIICSVPSQAASKPEKTYCARIVRTFDDGLPDYFLGGEQINAIAVDGGNRKWIGTEGSGVFLVSEDGMETIQSFTTDNSPILSNKILSIAINQETGEVFIGTDKGLVSYMGDAIEGKEDYSNIYAYPNPVRPEFNDRVTITGLMDESNVKITTVNGSIIYQGKSVGGQLVWNCRNNKGERVTTGIYLVLASTPEAKESVVTKIMVVK